MKLPCHPPMNVENAGDPLNNSIDSCHPPRSAKRMRGEKAQWALARDCRPSLVVDQQSILINSYSLNIDNINNIGTGGFPDFSALLKLPRWKKSSGLLYCLNEADVVALERLSRFAENDSLLSSSPPSYLSFQQRLESSNNNYEVKYNIDNNNIDNTGFHSITSLAMDDNTPPALLTLLFSTKHPSLMAI